MSTEPNTPEMAAPIAKPQAPPPPPYIISTLGPSMYCCTLDINRLSPDDPEFASVFLWLSSLSNTDSVRLSFTMSGAGPVDLVRYLPMINAIMICNAQTIALLDRMMTGYDCYFVMACKSVEVTPFAMLGIPSLMPSTIDRLSERDEAVVMCMTALLENAKNNLHIINDADIADLEDRKVVYIQPGELISRVQRG